MNERRGEGLPLAVTGDAKKVLLHAAVRSADDHLVSLGDDVVDRPYLLDLPEGTEEFAEPGRARGKPPRRPAVHRPSRSNQRAKLLNGVLTHEVQESPGSWPSDGAPEQPDRLT